MSGRPRTPAENRVVQVFDQARTAHLERLAGTSTSLLYRTRSYDFDERAAVAVNASRAGRLRMVARVVRARPDVVEVNEPLFVRAWPTTAAAVVGARLSGLVRRRRVPVVAYAIANDDPLPEVVERLPLPRRVAAPLVEAVVRGLARSLDRVAFGTDAAAETYAVLLRRSAALTRTFPPLPPPCPCGHGPTGPVVVFLGALEGRKGIADLLGAWDEVLDQVPHARLVVLGTGPEEDAVRRWTVTRSSTAFVRDPGRDEIHRRLREARVLVLPSRRTPRWREQIGLPILEGLAHGCEVVTTAETGLAPWLRAHGHRVCEPSGIAAAVVAALRSTRPAGEIVQDLPAVDGRAVAGAWLHGRGGPER